MTSSCLEAMGNAQKRIERMREVQMKRKTTLCALLAVLIMTSIASTAYAVTIFPLEGQESS